MITDTRLPFTVLQLCRQYIRTSPSHIRPLSTSTSTHAASPTSAPTTLGALGRKLSEQEAQHIAFTAIFGRNYQSVFDRNIPDTEFESLIESTTNPRRPQPYHLHIYATKHNTHINLTNPQHNPILSKSTGNIGFRKAARGTYDAAYQLTAYMLGQIYEGGLLQKIKGLEVVLRGFGVGREAVTKALLGAEGRQLRPAITQVTDTTRLKFGGTRSRKPRRLG